MTREQRKHGLSYTPEYRAWQQMRLRCTDPKHAAWMNYGGRGITVCERWLSSPAAFLDDMGKKPSPRHELDRIDNDRGYEPGNCRWVLRTVNCRNRRSSLVIEHDGRRMTLVEWAEACGVRPDTLRRRIDAGWTMADAISRTTRAKAPNGHARDPRKPCVDCARPVHGMRCKSCENRNRAALREAASPPAMHQKGSRKAA